MVSYLALYRKYRPNNFDDVSGQEKVVAVIKNAIVNNKVSHAYLFSGPRGTGKTTIAKILARLVNCENLSSDGKPCGKCYSCVNYFNSNDIVEIDAASNNGVDEIRELRDKINLVPSNSKYKVYIIDEVHMLTTQAFNALLKTLEEPPSHIIFILATTDPQKVPLTISSRCQKFQFSKLDVTKIVERLEQIVNSENIDIENDALFEIARLAEGGMRDAINILDQLVAYKNDKIILEDVYLVNGSISYDDVLKLMNAIRLNDKIEIIKFIDFFDNSGKEVNKFVQELIVFLKDVILYKNTGILTGIEVKNSCVKSVADLYDDVILYNFIEDLNETSNRIKFSSHSSIIFMTAVLKFSNNYFCEGTENISREIIKKSFDNKKEQNKKEQLKENISREIIKANEASSMSDKEIKVRINNSLALASKSFLQELKSNWNRIDDYIYDDSFSVVSGLLKDSVPVVGSSTNLIIVNRLDSVVNRINENILLIEKLLKKIFNYNMQVVAIDEDTWCEEKNKYIINLKKGIKYEIIDSKEKNTERKVKNSVDELIGLIGESVIEYK